MKIILKAKGGGYKIKKIHPAAILLVLSPISVCIFNPLHFILIAILNLSFFSYAIFSQDTDEVDFPTIILILFSSSCAWIIIKTTTNLIIPLLG